VGEQLAQAPDHFGRWSDSIGRAHQDLQRAKVLLLQAKGLANASLDSVALDGRGGVPARDQDAEPRRRPRAARDVESVAALAAPLAFAQQPLEIGLAPQPAFRIEAETLPGCGCRGYSPRRRRPRARRLRSTARPPRVRLRTRKPWRRARRVLDGW